MDWQAICTHISTASGRRCVFHKQNEISGGCINHSVVLEDKSQQRYFVKFNHHHYLDMFAAEAAGLSEIAASATVRVPQPLCWGIQGHDAYLVLEYLSLRGDSPAAQLGERLAAMHQVRHNYFGWTRNNTIGTTPQHNEASPNWCDFWREKRLKFQLQRAAAQGYHGTLQSQGAHLLENMAAFFSDYNPQPSLLHGDLWSGNQAADAQGNAVIFDPAVYYGDRETDVAMTELFGRFSPDFYRAYEHSWALDRGYKVRKTLYNLYHILNHLNLFGAGYQGQAERMIAYLLSELRG
jgi:protein-ribulosamine 3-kinase